MSSRKSRDRDTKSTKQRWRYIVHIVTVGISNATRCHSTQSGEEMATDWYQILTDPCTRSEKLIYAYTTDTTLITFLLDFLTRFTHDFQTIFISSALTRMENTGCITCQWVWRWYYVHGDRYYNKSPAWEFKWPAATLEVAI